MIAILILAAAIISSYLFSHALTPALKLMLSLIDGYVRRTRNSASGAQAQLLVFDMPISPGVPIVTSCSSLVLAATLLIVTTVPLNNDAATTYLAENNG